MGELLDRTCERALSFDAQDTAAEYRRALDLFVDHLLARARSRAVRSDLLRAKDALGGEDSVTLDRAAALLDKSYLRRRFRAVSKLLYSTVGARAANSEAIIPVDLWTAARLTDARSRVSLSSSTRQIAHAALMDYFVMDTNAIDGLTARAILDLKAEPMTARSIRELDQAIEEIAVHAPTASGLRDLTKFADDRAKSIRASVVARCQKEMRNLRVEGWVFGTVEEVGGSVGNLMGIGPIKKGLTSLARRLARRSENLHWLDYTSAPLVAYVSRYRDAVMLQRGTH